MKALSIVESIISKVNVFYVLRVDSLQKKDVSGE